jgi:4-amino-4-deoxy-L-arabinose transferase-like glycosyltransferase
LGQSARIGVGYTAPPAIRRLMSAMDRPPDTNNKFPHWLTFALALLQAWLWFGNLGLRTLTEPDEGRYAEIPREMLATGDWLAPHLNGIQYLEKPPLQYWGTAVLYQVAGTRPWVSRLYNAGLGFATLLLVAWAGRRFFTARAGIHAALILASGLLFYAMAHVNTLDMGLSFYLTAAAVAFAAAQTSFPDRASLRWQMWLAWLCIGLAILQKGLVALVLPGFAIALYVLVQRDWPLLRRLYIVSGLVIVLAVNGPWWWQMSRRNAGFVDWFFVHEHYTRFTTNEHGRSQPWWYFSALLLLGLLPWIVPVARGAAAAWRRSTVPGAFHVERFLLLWAAAVFIFYSPSGSKLAPYILPMMPPLALLSGRRLALLKTTETGLRSTLWLAAAMALALLSLPFVASRLNIEPLYRAGYQVIAHTGAWAGTLLALAVALSAWLARQRLRLSAVAVLASGLIASLALFSNASNELERWRGGTQLANDVRPHLRDGAQLFCLDNYPQVTIFSLAQTCRIAGDYGELETQFADEHSWLRSDADFASAWAAAPAAVAMIEPRNAAKWLALAGPHVVVVNRPYAIVIAKPVAGAP